MIPIQGDSMRSYAAGLIALLLGACGQTQNDSVATAGCARGATHHIIWSSAAAPDVITARSDGPTCAQAIVTFTARNAQGDPLWAFASTYYAITAGDGAPPEGFPPVSNEEMDRFLASWAEVTEMTSGDLPEWRDVTLTDSSEGLAYVSPLTAESYPLVRERNVPLICFAIGAETSQCVMIDPFANAPALVVTVSP